MFKLLFIRFEDRHVITNAYISDQKDIVQHLKIYIYSFAI